MRLLGTLLALVQLWSGLRVLWRLIQTGGGVRIHPSEATGGEASVTVLLPVLNEAERVGPCLEGLLAQPAEVGTILVIDGGSTDTTRELVASFAERDHRVRLVDAAPIPAGVNGKAHGLQAGLTSAPASAWVLTIDADVRSAPALTRSLLAMAARTGDAVLSVATGQRLSGPAEGILHPALLTTLVYRYGIPGHATRHPDRVQANGQCCLLRRSALEAVGGFAPGLGSVCEDVTVARAIAATGQAVGFYEATGGLVWTAMYAGWRDAWTNWTRSLPMVDDRSGPAAWLGLVDVCLVQALPLPMLALARTRSSRLGPLLRLVNVVLVATRLGVLAGTARAYQSPPWTYWLSPLADLPVTIKLLHSATRRQHTWRGRPMMRTVRGDS